MLPYTIFVVALVALTSVNCDIQLFDGRDISPGQQCVSRGGGRRFGGVCRAADPAERCLHLKCADTESLDIPFPYDVGPALQGTTCGENKICIAGQCTVDPEPPKKPLEIKDFQYRCEIPW